MNLKCIGILWRYLLWYNLLIKKHIKYININIIGVIKMTYYCPECGNEVECIQGCGSTGYFCNKCNKLISSKAILTEASTKKDKE